MKNKEVSFYQLTTSALEKTLPALLEKVYQKGLRALVILDSPERVDTLDYTLWTYSPGSFLPHAAKGDPQDHPIWLATENINRNQADVAVITTGENVDNLGSFDRCIDIFDGNQEGATEQALTRLEAYQHQGYKAQFWEQTREGRWQEKVL